MVFAFPNPFLMKLCRVMPVLAVLKKGVMVSVKMITNVCAHLLCARHCAVLSPLDVLSHLILKMTLSTCTAIIPILKMEKVKEKENMLYLSDKAIKRMKHRFRTCVFLKTYLEHVFFLKHFIEV